MVKIRIFLPHLEIKDLFEEVIRNLPVYEDIRIETCYVFGTPDFLSRNWDDDIMIARGMTYLKLKDSFPTKHIVELKFNSFDILDALLACRKRGYHRIALFLTNVVLHDLPILENVCNAIITPYDVTDEEDSMRKVRQAVTDGAEIIVGAGTVCGICDRLGISRIHIKIKKNAIEEALKEAISTAVTMNRERERSSIIQSVFNNSEDGLIATDDRGMVQYVNNWIYQSFKLSAFDQINGRAAGDLHASDPWKKLVSDVHHEQEAVMKLDGQNVYVHVKPYRENDVTSGALIRLRNTNQIIQEEGKIRQQLAKEGLMAKYHFKDILGSSKAIRENIEMAERYSKVNSNILILGETGTGKELFADSIHNASLRADKPFVAINCAALPENLLESELFGYEPGAFSGASRQGKIGLFELADKGTLFLDEIGEMPIALQAKLLRVLQEKEVRRIGSTNVHSVDVRVISATNIDIEREVEEGKFRPDLYYRLDLLDIRIPPLRERKEDIEELFSSFVAKIASEMGRKVPHLTDDAAEMLKNYRWKGNVRELRNICERLVVLNDSDSVNADTMRLLNIFRDQPKPQKEAVQTRTYTTSKKVNQTEIARELGISRTTLWRRNRKKEGGTTQ